VLAHLQQETGEPYGGGIVDAPITRTPRKDSYHAGCRRSAMASQELSWGIGRQYPCMLPESTYRTRQDQSRSSSSREQNLRRRGQAPVACTSTTPLMPLPAIRQDMMADAKGQGGAPWRRGQHQGQPWPNPLARMPTAARSFTRRTEAREDTIDRIVPGLEAAGVAALGEELPGFRGSCT
jgi:hypothetical protein